MPYFKLTSEERSNLIIAANQTPDTLFSLVEDIIDQTLSWEPGRWWVVLDEEGDIWCETSDEFEARRKVRHKKGDTLHRQYVSKQFSKLEAVPLPIETNKESDTDD